MYLVIVAHDLKMHDDAELVVETRCVWENHMVPLYVVTLILCTNIPTFVWKNWRKL